MRVYLGVAVAEAIAKPPNDRSSAAGRAFGRVTPRQWLPGAAGQPLESIVMAHQVRTISKRRLRHALGYLQDAALREAVRTGLREHLDLE